MNRRLGSCLLALLLLTAWPVMGQEAISAKAGLVNYFEGTVLLNGEELSYSVSKFHQIPNGGTLETPANGRAEVLLTPGVMLWLGESSKLELISDQIDAAQLRLVGGNAVISSTEFPKDASVTLFVDDNQVTLSKSGVYHLTVYPAKLEVHQGQADVLRAGVETRVKKGRAMLLDQPGSALASIDKNANPDPLALWAETRDNYMTMANVSAARQMQTAGGFSRLGNLGMLGAYSGFGGWVYNPYFGMYTLVPFGAGFVSPFGHYFWGPQTVRAMYTPFLFGGGGFGNGAPARGAMSRNSISRSGFSNNAAYGSASYTRGGSSTGDVFATSPRGRGGFSDPGGFSRGSASYGGGGYGRGGGGYSSSGGYSGGGGGYSGGGGASAPTSSGGASMGRGGGGGASSGGGGGRGGN